jgi:hypothetical protein
MVANVDQVVEARFKDESVAAAAQVYDILTARIVGVPEFERDIGAVFGNTEEVRLPTSPRRSQLSSDTVSRLRTPVSHSSSEARTISQKRRSSGASCSSGRVTAPAVTRAPTFPISTSTQ